MLRGRGRSKSRDDRRPLNLRVGVHAPRPHRFAHRIGCIVVRSSRREQRHGLAVWTEQFTPALPFSPSQDARERVFRSSTTDNAHEVRQHHVSRSVSHVPISRDWRRAEIRRRPVWTEQFIASSSPAASTDRDVRVFRSNSRASHARCTLACSRLDPRQAGSPVPPERHGGTAHGLLHIGGQRMSRCHERESKRMSKIQEKPEITSLSLDDLDVAELEARIELAANAAGCDCNGGCGSHCGSKSCKPV